MPKRRELMWRPRGTDLVTSFPLSDFSPGNLGLLSKRFLLDFAAMDDDQPTERNHFTTFEQYEEFVDVQNRLLRACRGQDTTANSDEKENSLKKLHLLVSCVIHDAKCCLRCFSVQYLPRTSVSSRSLPRTPHHSGGRTVQNICSQHLPLQ